HGRCAPIAALRGEYLGIRRPRDLHLWECPLVPGGLNQRAKVARVLAGEISTVAQSDDPAAWLMTEQECRKSHRNHDRLEMARRQIDDQTRDLASPDLLDHMGDRVDVPV